MSARPDLGPTRTLAWLYCPAAQRPVLAALVGIEAEVGASLAPGLEHAVAHARLAWWREECVRLAHGEGQHPLTRQLQELFTGVHRAALAGLCGFVDVAIWDLAGATFETRGELTGYCERWSAALIDPCAAFALKQPQRTDLRAFGRSLRELELLNCVVSDAHAGRVRVPLEELDAAQLRPEQLAQAPWTPALTRFVRAQHQRARASLAAGIAAVPAHEQAALRSLLVWAALVQQRSRRIATALPRATTTGDHHAPLDGWRAWRAARQADSGQFTLPAS